MNAQHASPIVAPKGLTAPTRQLGLEHAADGGWNVAAGELPLPAATLSAAALDHNIATMARWCEQHGALLAPHGKTTMAPALFARQLAAGAWGITVSSARQAQVAVAAGAQRVIVAHQVVDPIQLADLAALARRVEVFVFVDSVAGYDRLAAHAARDARLAVLVEIGIPGVRTGVRTAAELHDLLARLRSDGRLPVAGVAAFEGLLPAIRRTLPEEFGALAPTTEAVSAYLRSVAEMIAGARDRGLLDPAAIVTAGGSAAFDLVVDILGGVAGPLVLRSGCYVTHDHGLYDYQSPLEARNDPALSPADALRAALALWAHVVSQPEPGVAIVGLGRRDAGDDVAMPMPLERVLGPGRREPLRGWTMDQMWDQHARLRAHDGATALTVGDVLVFGVSHPCTTLDKWRALLEIDEADRVVGVLETWF